ncbi:MAG: galactan 5-O-arabinofuranosyltransferase [Mycobacteriaceae bacterium]|nr:galactan 5-O-arabinofuranosyltransferase [Mycobacteriaceae bacterium]
MRDAVRTVGQLLLAATVATAVSALWLIAIAKVDWPAYPSSNQLHALTTVGQVGCLAGLTAVGWLWRHCGRYRLPLQLGGLVLVCSFSAVTLGMPLGATKLYLFGISVDQQFRTEYLTRLTDSPALRDMTYVDLPPFYPPGWFWIGGRVAALTGAAGWEMYKPWAITSITIAVAMALVLWWRMIRFEYALVVTAATAAVMLAYSSSEPYSAIITVLLPPMLVLTWSGLRAGAGAVIGAGIFLGIAATWYTLLLAYTAFTAVVMALLIAGARWREIRPGHRLSAATEPLLRLAVIALIAAAIAAITWLPFLLRATHSPVSNTGSAQHYLPADGAQLNFPMLQFTLLGAVCMVGTLWLVVRAHSSARAAALTVGVCTVYLWSLLSMLTTLARTTLLSFRLQPLLLVLLAAAGAFGFLELTQAIRRQNWGHRVVPVAAVLGLAGAIEFSQTIPEVLRPDLTIAYTDTDGNSQRGDRRPPGSEKFYPSIDAAIHAATGKARNQTVVLTADYSFLSYYPYFGFQGLTSHYANPLAQFDLRAAQIESWAKYQTSDQLIHALDTLPWQPPTVFLMRHGTGSGPGATYTLRLAKDVYPNQPNVRRYTVDLKAALFADSRFTVQNLGPFVLAIRTPTNRHQPELPPRR